MIAAHEAHMAAMEQQAQPVQQQQQQQHENGMSGGSGGMSGGASSGGAGSSHGRDRHEGGSVSPPAEEGHEYTTLKPDDFEAIKLLKRELAIAVQEEDYAAAIRLRDHPYMQLYRRMEAFDYVGRTQEAASIRQELAKMIDASNE
ncbi:hypothetical protein GPECTOR_1g676 [Gonium pectorale]|uniref:Uncharacterized protein n=1 Tax=Gonium pectorale TaxID=33097 RepID=A0A150H550_GONPE|nr:hypothetical protein GPECTOR_1g676 [Gonium pectorale]|eukprot:KXZ56750.1 hypothetical protein GPECTOR_1g676 [Gonium pectorale]